MRSRSCGISQAAGPYPATTNASSMKSSGPTVISSMTPKTATAFADQVARPVERAGEVEAEHPRAAVRAQRLRRDERGEERERAADEERVLAVRDEVLLEQVVGERRDDDGEQGGEESDDERDHGQHLVPRAAPEPEHALGREPGERDDRARRPVALAVVAPVAEVEELCAVARAHSPAPR